MNRIAIGIAILMPVAVACSEAGGASTPTPAEAVAPSTDTVTPAPLATKTPATAPGFATQGGERQAPASPTQIAPTPTATPAPALTATRMTTPEPVSLSGRGDKLSTSFNVVPGVFVLTAFHDGDSTFAIEIVSETDGRSELSVNVIGRYSGARAHPVDDLGIFGLTPGPHRIRISADGNWRIALLQPDWTGRAFPPGPYSSRGDDVVAPLRLNSGITPLQMTYDGESNFTVQFISVDGTHTELIANEIGPYSGTAALQAVEGSPFGLTPGNYAVVIEADGWWTIELGE